MDDSPETETSQNPPVLTNPPVVTANRTVKWVGAFLVIVVAAYMVLVPTAYLVWESLFAAKSQPGIRRLDVDMSLAEQVRLKTVEAVIAAIFFAIGASIGSFLNVVVYRLPNRIPLFWRRSRCPGCSQAIRSGDNVPLIGWLRLGGRCRSCRSPISIRYPLIEGIMGSIFLLLFSVQLISGGWNLPNRLPNTYAGLTETVLYIKWDLVAYYFYHGLLFSMLLVVALIDFDRRRLTVLQVMIGTLGLALPAFLWPTLLLWQLPGFGNPYVALLLTQVVGGTLGWVIGSLLNRHSHGNVGLLWIGVALGWQAVLGTTLILFLFTLLFRLPLALFFRSVNASMLDGSEARTFCTWLLWTTLVHHVLWRLLTTSLAPWWPGGTVNWLLVLVWLLSAAGLFVLCQAIRWLNDRSDLEPIPSWMGDEPS